MERKEKIKFLTDNIRGVGPAKAEKIADAFEDTVNLIDIARFETLKSKLVDIVGHKLASDIVSQLIKIDQQDEAVQAMVLCGIPFVSATNIAKNLDVFEAFKKNPYSIGRKYDLQFEHCDRFAHILFCEGESPDMSKARMQWCIEAMIANLENSGHTFVYLGQLTKKINQYQRRNEYLPDNYADSTLAMYLAGNDFVDVQRVKSLKKWKIYRSVTAELESDIAYHIRRLAKTEVINNSDVPDIDVGKFNYDDIQLAAIKSAAVGGLKVVTGPPGSGKTAVINGIIKYYSSIKKGAKIVLCAPTGRAAQHMSEITGREASTIHKLLGISETKQFMNHAKLDCDMVICDEASMLNLDVTYELLSRIATGATVYFVGDKAQLPAVGPGNVLHDIIDSGVVPVYHLTKVYRQDGIILFNAHDINSGIVPIRMGKQYVQKTYDSPLSLKEAAIEWFKKNYDPSDPFETQILIPSYKTECGITAINAAIQELNTENIVYRGYGSNSSKALFKKYDKILMTKNNKDGLYQNGSVGIILANYGDSLLVEFDGEETVLPLQSVEDMTLGYAISIHKSQGSEYKHVLVCLPDKPEKMLKRNIIYTAVTRAKHDVAIYEMPGTMECAVRNNPETFMQTGLKEKLVIH